MPSQWLAVEAETDPLTRARQLQRSWERLLADGALGSELPPGATEGLRPTIVESWRRSLATGLDPTDVRVPIEVDQSEARERWLEHPLGSHAYVLEAQLRALAEETQSLVVVTDASGLLLNVDGEEWLKERAREMNFVEGAPFSEAVDGTNGIGTALAADHALQVFAFEHFNERHHQWICSGAPVHDPVSGRTVGLIDLSSLWKIAHPRSLELVTTAARTIEQCLVHARRDREARLRRRYSDLMTRSTDLLVDRDGYMLDGAEPVHRTPLDIHEGGGEVVLRDGSVAVAERLGQGEAYLLRQVTSRHRKSAPVEALKRAEERARELATEQAALRQVATLVARESSPDRLFAVVAEQVARVFDVPLVTLVRFEPDGSEVVGGFSEGDDEPFPLRSRWPLDSPGVIASVRQTGRPARVDDYTNVPGKAAAIVRRTGMRSAVASPIVVAGRLWGAMVVLVPRREPLPADTAARLTDFTELVAAAIANAGSRVAIGRLADEQAALRRVATLVAQQPSPDEVFTAVTEAVGSVLGADLAAMYVYPGEGTASVIASWSESGPMLPVGTTLSLDGDGVAARIFRTGAPARVDNYVDADSETAEIAYALQLRSAVGAPILVGGNLWGAVTAATRGAEPPSESAESRIAAFTELVATAISNAEAQRELQRVAVEQAALRRAATLVASGASPADVFAAITTSASEVFGVPFASLIRAGPAELATMVAGCAACSAYVGTTWTVPTDDPGITRAVLKSHRPSRIEDHSRVHGPIGEAARTLGVSSVVGAPVVVDGAVWGVLAVGATQDGPQLPADTRERLIGFTELVSTAIADSDAKEKVERMLNEQAALRRVATLVARRVSPNELFAAVSNEVATLFDAEIATVGRFEATEPPEIIAVGVSEGPNDFLIGVRSPLLDWLASTTVYGTGRTARKEVTAEDITDPGTLSGAVRALSFFSTVSAPIVVEGELWGVVTASRSQESLPADTERRIESFSELLATAIANAGSRAALAASEARKSAILEWALDCIITIDHEGNILEFNPAAEATFGYRREDVLGKEMAELIIPPSLRKQHYRGLERYLETGEGPVLRKRVELEGLRSDGTTFPVELTITPITLADLPMFTAYMRDISERKRGEEERARLLVGERAARTEAEAASERAQDLAREQAALRRVATLVAQGASPDELFTAVAQEVAGIIDIPIVRVNRFEADGTFTMVGIAGQTKFTVGSRWPVPEDGIAEMIVTTGRPAHKDDYSTMRGPLGDALRGDLTTSTFGVPIVVEGSIWGFMVAAGRPGRPIPPDTEERLARFTELVATAVSNATTRTDLLTSRARLVTTADETRRRLERDLHDGIQQWLVALALKARKAAALSAAGASAAQELSGLADDLVAVTDELREISRGIHPAILSDAGLDDALKALARRSAVRVHLDADFQRRYEPTLEATVYYVVAESITNAAKHAQASIVEMRGGLRDGAIDFEIKDDGVGGADPRRGTGMIGLKDRVETLGGTISFASPAGAGTTIRVTLPASPRDEEDLLLRGSDEVAAAPASG
jgi:PAS domain S-box-containing protein